MSVCARCGGEHEPGSDLWFEHEHGVSATVARGRPYIRWTDGDQQPLRDAYTGLEPGQRATMTKRAGLRDGQSPDGLIIVRYRPPGMNVPHIYPEIRPDVAVKTGWTRWHYHPSTPPPAGFVPVYPEEAGERRARTPLPTKAISTAHAMRKHIAGKKGHQGVNDEGVHSHQKRAKYVFPPGAKVPKVWFHDHDDAYGDRQESRRRHVERWHDGIDVAGRHQHQTWMKDPNENLARRIDVHPFIDFENARRVFFGIEGCIKADAILSAGEAVFSVPSVTLWDAPELAEFAARFLRGKEVVIVPDADWIENGLVVTQALLCRSFLRGLGLHARIAAPPDDRDDEGELAYKGVDDFLAAGGDIEGLHVIDREAPVLKQWIALQHGRHDRIRRDADVLEALALHADEHGIIDAPLRKLATVMGTSKSRVCRGIQSLIDSGAVSVNMPLSVKCGVWRGGTRSPDGHIAEPAAARSPGHTHPSHPADPQRLDGSCQPTGSPSRYRRPPRWCSRSRRRFKRAAGAKG